MTAILGGWIRRLITLERPLNRRLMYLAHVIVDANFAALLLHLLSAKLISIQGLYLQLPMMENKSGEGALMFTGDDDFLLSRITNTTFPHACFSFFSGTVVDDELVLELGTLLRISENETARIRELNQPNKTVFNSQSNSSDDFLLTAQGGLKGTSKPVYYRVRL